MSILGDGKSIVELLARGLTWVRERRDPVRAQAHRMIDAFEAHSIARQRIARVLPPELAVPPAALSTPDKLKDKVVGIARSLGILVVGRLMLAPILRKMEAGRVFAPQAHARGGRLWHPEDLLADSESGPSSLAQRT